MTNTFNRLFFCEKCFLVNGPDENDDCFVFNFKDNNYTISKFKTLIKNNSFTKGFTPHIYQILDIKEDKVEYVFICGICGVKKEIIDNQRFNCTLIGWQRNRISLDKWNEIAQKGYF